MLSNHLLIPFLVFVTVAALLSGFLGYRKARSSTKPFKSWILKGLAFAALLRGTASLMRAFHTGFSLVAALVLFVAFLASMFYLLGGLSIAIRDKKEQAAKARAPF